MTINGLNELKLEQISVTENNEIIDRLILRKK